MTLSIFEFETHVMNATNSPYNPAPDDVFPPSPPSYLDSTYTCVTIKNASGIPGNDILVCAHPNGIAFLAFAPSHESLASPPTLIDFNVSPSLNLFNAEFRKGRGPWIQIDQPLFKTVGVAMKTDTDSSGHGGGGEYSVVSPVHGILVEINHRMLPSYSNNSSGGVSMSVVETPEEIEKAVQVMANEYIVLLQLKDSEIERLKGMNGEG